MKRYRTQRAIVVLGLVMSVGVFLPSTAGACGGQTASMGIVGERWVAWTHEDGNPRAMDHRANIPPAEIFIPPALADAIAEKYVSTAYPNAQAVDFHAFLYEHGSYVYMYDITDPSIRNTSTVTACGSNPQKSESDSMDIHIDAVTGDVWDGQGCGGGPAVIVMRYQPEDYPAGLTAQLKDLTQFHSEFVIPVDGEVRSVNHKEVDGHAREEDNHAVQRRDVTIDGRLGDGEWDNAASLRLEQYGKTLDIKAKIDGEKAYWAIEADTKNWLALLLKTSPHHGMVWEFTDAKLLSKNGVEDYHVVYKGMMAGAGLGRDRSGSVLEQATSETEHGRVWEFSMPLRSGTEGVNFQIGEYGNMAFYFGSTETFSGRLVYDDAFSKQMMVHVGREIHRGVISPIVPEAAAAVVTGAERATGEELSDRNTRVFWSVLAVAVLFGFVFRKRLGREVT